MLFHYPFDKQFLWQATDHDAYIIMAKLTLPVQSCTPPRTSARFAQLHSAQKCNSWEWLDVFFPFLHTNTRYTLGDQNDILSLTLNNHSSDWTFLINTGNTFKTRKTIENICDISMSSRNVTKKTDYPCLSTATLSNRTLSFWSIAAVCRQPGIRQLSSNHLKKVSEAYMTFPILKHGGSSSQYRYRVTSHLEVKSSHVTPLVVDSSASWVADFGDDHRGIPCLTSTVKWLLNRGDLQLWANDSSHHYAVWWFRNPDIR